MELQDAKAAASKSFAKNDEVIKIDESTREEGNKKITTTIVHRKDYKDTYQKVVASYGIVYFKNDKSISQALYEQQLKTAKTQLGGN
jgi:GGDEF domain-containing protein